MKKLVKILVKILIIPNRGRSYHAVRPEAECYIALAKLGHDVTIMITDWLTTTWTHHALILLTTAQFIIGWAIAFCTSLYLLVQYWSETEPKTLHTVVYRIVDRTMPAKDPCLSNRHNADYMGILKLLNNNWTYRE